MPPRLERKKHNTLVDLFKNSAVNDDPDFIVTTTKKGNYRVIRRKVPLYDPALEDVIGNPTDFDGPDHHKQREDIETIKKYMKEFLSDFRALNPMIMMALMKLV